MIARLWAAFLRWLRRPDAGMYGTMVARPAPDLDLKRPTQ
jgi:hypothetical protein